jgi:pyruvate dehydrogenase E1 component
VSPKLNTPFVNSIHVDDEEPYPGDRTIERNIKSILRWNAMAMVVQQNKKDPGIGGHISTYASQATLMEVGFNHFFRASYGDQPGDLVYFQGHASPGVYARAHLEGRLKLKNPRTSVTSSMRMAASFVSPSLAHADFWSFPTVSMGLGPLNAIYQARFMRYLRIVA